MKLVGLYIENFGGLHQYALDFEAGITSLIQPNGFGKTTLAEFIRAMFYGFPRKSKTLEKSLRQKYTPWNGGSFGGNLTFAYQGQCYRIERTFGANPKGDTFAVIDLDTGRKTNRFPEEIGQELFGLDAESFERSAYLPQLRETGDFLTASVQAKLSDLVEESGDVANYDKAMAALRAERSALQPYRGSGGSVAETAANISRLQLRLDTLYAQETRLGEVQETAARQRQTVERVQKELADLGQRLREAARREGDILRRRQYEQLCARHSGAEAAAHDIRQKYSGALPQEDGLRSAELAAERLKQSREETRKQPCLSRSQLEECRRLWAEYEMLQSRLCAPELPEEEKTVRQGKRRKGLSAALMMFGAAAMAAGVTVPFPSVWLAWAVLALGAAAVLTGLTAVCVRSVKGRRYRKAEAEKRLQRQQETKALGRRVDFCRKQMAVLFASVGLSAQPERYGDTMAELERRISRKTSQEREEQADVQLLQAFFAPMGLELPMDIHGALLQLREDLRAVQNAQTLAQALAEQITVMEETCGEMLFEEDPEEDDLQRLQQQETGLREEMTAATTRMLRSEQEARQLQDVISAIPAVREELQAAQQRLTQQRETVKLLDATMEFLQQARENLSTAYMGTIRSRFGYYLSKLEGGDGEYLVDSQLRVQPERQGQTRELAYFSAGQTDLVLLCMRLALVDALFKNEEMFVILDDPFVNLDDEHMEQARRLLPQLASQRQMLYLTCHSGRAL